MEKLNQFQSILVVEDSDDDYEMMMEGLLEDGTLKNPIVRCESGQEALDYLFGNSSGEGGEIQQTPGIILLDLNLPGIDGRQVLRRVKDDPASRKIPIVILTTSNDGRDIEECYSLGANTYIQKPVDLQRFLAAIQRLKEYWLEVAILPKEQGDG